MITNERQYKVTRLQLSNMRKALKEFNVAEVTKRLGSQILAESELKALKSQEEELRDQLKEYELLKSGKIKEFKATSLQELPGILVRARIALGLTQRELAERVGLKEQQIQRYESEGYASASLRRMQKVASSLQLNITEIAELSDMDKPNEVTTLDNKQRSDELEWSKFPVAEMYKRHWFDDFEGSLDAALAAANTLIPDFVNRATGRSLIALHRKRVRTGSQIDEYALLAWECRVLLLAAKEGVGSTFDVGAIDNRWITALARISEKPDAPLYAKEHLKRAGIVLVVEPHLPSTHLDGAALWSKGGPVIGLTLRYDRVDNFWFVLFHELFHVIKHINRSKINGVFDDLESQSTDTIEIEADTLSSEALIPENDWSSSLARYVRSPESVIDFAKSMHISPAIVAGRIRHEANNYVILKDLVGQGEVRKYFPGASFGS